CYVPTLPRPKLFNLKNYLAQQIPIFSSVNFPLKLFVLKSVVKQHRLTAKQFNILGSRRRLKVFPTSAGRTWQRRQTLFESRVERMHLRSVLQVNVEHF